MQKTLTCIICPVGCEITVTGTGDAIEKIEGNECKRGCQYATDEYIDPRRILTTTVKIKGHKLPVVSVRSDKPLPQNMIFNCIEELKKVSIQAPVEIGQVVIENIFDTDINIITTRC